MSFRRMLNSSGIFSATRSESLFLVLVVIVILVMYIYSQILYEQNSKLLCRSEINLHSTLNKSGIHVIPSVPEKRGWFQDDSDQVAGKFNPFNHECVDYETAQESGTLLICIHDPKKDLMVSAHLKVR
uniref:Uncharacterized protein n=1 Tax=Arion vulgaris TaxID=1028688 RepID=A0A0B6YQC1_9EUPU